MAKYTNIGGQALLEGIMMRGPERTAMAVRNREGRIRIEQFETISNKNRPKICRLPVIRGVFGLIDSLRIGYKCLMRSADLSGLAEEEENAKKKKKQPSELSKKMGKVMEKVMMPVATVLAVVLAVFLFVYLPAQLYSLLAGASPALEENYFLRSLFEGVVKIVIFVGYVAATALMKDIRRTYQYHGAEHKTIFCYEQKLPMTVENVRKQRRFHPRCGTSFLILMLLVGIFVGLFIRVPNPLLRAGLRILAFPLMIGLGYELIQFAGRHDNWLTRVISAPGIAIQHITTKEPDDSMIECAIASMQCVIPENDAMTDEQAEARFNPFPGREDDSEPQKEGVQTDA